MNDPLEPVESDWHQLNNACIRKEDVQAWRWANGSIFIWFRYREEAVIFNCDSVALKAFELAIKTP